MKSAVWDLDSLMERKISHLESFRIDQPGLWTTIDGAYLSSRALLIAATKHAPLELAKSETEPLSITYRLSLWQTVTSYQMQSFFLLIDKCLDEGFALLRMAAELARDVARLADNGALLSIWQDRRNGVGEERRYRTAFKFAVTDTTEAYVFKLYNLMSQYGVHGHQTSELHSAVQAPSSDDLVVTLEVPEIAVHKVLLVWLAAFFPLQSLCDRAFRSSREPSMVEAAKRCDACRTAYEALLVEYRATVEKMRAS